MWKNRVIELYMEHHLKVWDEMDDFDDLKLIKIEKYIYG